MKTRTRAAALAGVLVAAAVPLVVLAPSAQAVCGTTVDIGVTVHSGGKIKGSGSYTAATCQPLQNVTLVIIRDSVVQGATSVTRTPPEPSSATFSPIDYTCTTSAFHTYKTRISWTYPGGGGGNKESNSITVQC